MTPDPSQPKTTRAKPDPAVKRLIIRHAEKFQDKFRFKLRVAWGRNGKEIKEMLGVWSEDDIQTLQDEFFQSKDPRIARSYTPDYSIAHFARVAQLLRLPAAARIEPRTADNMEAVRRAVQGRPRQIGQETEDR